MSAKKETAQLNVEIPQAVHRDFKALAAIHGKTMKQLAGEVLVQFSRHGKGKTESPPQSGLAGWLSGLAGPKQAAA